MGNLLHKCGPCGFRLFAELDASEIEIWKWDPVYFAWWKFPDYSERDDPLKQMLLNAYQICQRGSL